MATFTKFNAFTKDLAEGKHNLASDVITIALCGAAHAPIATNSTLSNLTQIAYTNLSSRVVTTTSSTQTSGVYKLCLTDITLTASGAVEAFQYVVLYNDTATSDQLIGWYDIGSVVTLANTDTFTCNFSEANGVLTIT